MEEKLIGKIAHYFGKISVAIVELSRVLKVGDHIHIKGHTSGKQVAIITEEQIKGKNIAEKTEKEIQSILDGWIEEENKKPSKYTQIDGKEVDILQNKISVRNITKSVTKVTTDIKQRVR